MSRAIAARQDNTMAAIEQVLIQGDLERLTPEQRAQYYLKVCETVGLNPTTKPFDYIKLSGKLVLYANKGCAEQLRQIHKISIRITARETHEGVYVVTAQAEGKGGRVDESTGAVTIQGLRGDFLANAMLKAETKAKRRVTLSICGLNMLDESEVATIPDAKPFQDEPANPRVIPSAAKVEAVVTEPEPPAKPRTVGAQISYWIGRLGMTPGYVDEILEEKFKTTDRKKLKPAQLQEFLGFLQEEAGRAGMTE